MFDRFANHIRAHRIFWAGLSGLLLAISFPPTHLAVLSSFAWVPMLVLAENANWRSRFRDFFLFGLVATAGTLYWVGNVVAPGLWHVILFGLVLLCGFFGLFYGVAGVWAGWFYRRWGAAGMLLLPPFWVLLEYVRGLSELSFPWCTIGYTWGAFKILIQGLDLIGVYGYSLIIGELGVALYLLFRPSSPRLRLRTTASLVITFLFLEIYGQIRLHQGPPNQGTARVAMIQANIDQLAKWDEAFLDSTVSTHLRMTQDVCEKVRPDFVLWSETSLPMYIMKRPMYHAKVRALVDSIRVPILFGSLDFSRIGDDYTSIQFSNCAFWARPGIDSMIQYRKIRLVPFSEYLPFGTIFPIINRVDLGEADFTPGTKPVLLSHKEAVLSPSICYEIVYPSLIRRSVASGANLLVNITNDGWFGRTSAPFQHLNMARFRCIENRISLARCANTGVTAIVDPKGTILKQTRIMKRAYLEGEVPLSHRPTLYTRFGDWIVGVCLFACLFGLISLARRPKPKPE